MWFITHTTNGSSFYFNPGKPTYSVGRQGTDLELPDDVCVSRSHAVFHISDDHIELEDAGSKYGTFCNEGLEKNQPLEKDVKLKLRENDLVRFGRLQNIWKVQKLLSITVTSSLSPEDAAAVAVAVKALGGQILPQWSSNCTHLTMKEPSVTIKLLHALLDQKYIVSPSYWNDLAKAVAKKDTKLPSPGSYCPDFGNEKFDLGFNEARKHLFGDTIFVFLSKKHVDMYGPIVRAAGGTYKDINAGVQKTFMAKDNVVVIQYTPSTYSQSTQTISSIEEFLKSHSKRIIPEYEIGLAILHCSKEEYCNPCFRMTETMAQTIPNADSDNSLTSEIKETEAVTQVNTQLLDFEIPETGSNMVTSTPYDNPAVVPDTQDNINTMPNMNITETPVEANRKRKHVEAMNPSAGDSDDDDLFQFAKKTCTTDKAQPEAITAGKDDENVAAVAASEKESGCLTAMKPKARAIKRSAFADFLSKTNNKSKDATLTANDSEDANASDCSAAKKRPLINVLGEEDNNGEENDLFCFGNTQAKKRPMQEDDEDLFDFKEPAKKQCLDSIAVDDGESNSDAQQTSSGLATKKSSFVMPKPKVLPQKLSAIDWLSHSLGKTNIKAENEVKNEDAVKNEEDVKPSLDDLNMSEEHRKWLDSLKEAIQIQEVALNISAKANDKSHYKFKNQSAAAGTSANGVVKNFKAFVKRHNYPARSH